MIPLRMQARARAMRGRREGWAEGEGGGWGASWRAREARAWSRGRAAPRRTRRSSRGREDPREGAGLRRGSRHFGRRRAVRADDETTPPISSLRSPVALRARRRARPCARRPRAWPLAWCPRSSSRRLAPGPASGPAADLARARPRGFADVSRAPRRSSSLARRSLRSPSAELRCAWRKLLAWGASRRLALAPTVSATSLLLRPRRSASRCGAMRSAVGRAGVR